MSQNNATIRIAMWSGPRNISTAMMRSWENRKDSSVVDEPFYAYYLAQTQSPHPMFEEVLASQKQDYNEVAFDLTQTECETELQYQKHMTHHMLNNDFDWAKDLKHCFLIRTPAEVVNSYTNRRGVCSAEDIGIIRQAEIYERLSEITGQDIPVVDSNEVLKDPKTVLSKLCTRLGISFDHNMLSWPAGRRDSDGVWATHWYHSVEESTEFAPFQNKALNLSDEQMKVVEEVMPSFLALQKRKI